MSQSTPIFNIPRDNYQQNDQSRVTQHLIDDNVDEMHVSVDDAYRLQQQNMQLPQQALQQFPSQPLPMPNDFSAQMQPQYQSQLQFQGVNSNLYVPSQMRGQQDMYQMPQGGPQQQGDDWYSYVLREFKESIIIAVLFVILNISIVQKLLQMYIPYMDNVYLELIVRGIVCGVLFYFTKRFWK
jgi:hypothetical protein